MRLVIRRMVVFGSLAGSRGRCPGGPAPARECGTPGTSAPPVRATALFARLTVRRSCPLQEPGHRRQHPLARPLAPDVDLDSRRRSGRRRCPRRSNSWSSSSSRMFASSGERGPPWGVPSCRSITTPSASTPASRYRRITRSTRAIADPFGQPPHQHVVVDPVEELLQVEVHHPASPARHVLPRRLQRLVRALAGAKPVARRRERRLVVPGSAPAGSLAG